MRSQAKHTPSRGCAYLWSIYPYILVTSCSTPQEQERYISELEGQQRIPEGKEVVHPLPGFVIKTRFTRGSAKDAEPEKVSRWSGRRSYDLTEIV